ncbi:MAG: phosphoserine phosphatase SerB [Methylococcales bacterium]
MKYRLCLHGGTLSTADARLLLSVTDGELIHCGKRTHLLSKKALRRDTLDRLEETIGIDINALPEGFEPDRVGLVISDMDSTFVNIECIDEIADMLGIKPQIAAITESAMRGEIDFASALRQRVALLKGLSVESLEEVYRDRLRLNPGAEALLDELDSRGIPFALVSGGFTFFTERLKQRYRLYAAKANRLEVNDGLLSGRIQGPIVDASGKAEFLLETCESLSIEPAQAIAIGDGANDLEMMAAAGLGVAYHAKPAVQQAADIRLNRSGLEGVCDLFWTNQVP